VFEAQLSEWKVLIPQRPAAPRTAHAYSSAIELFLWFLVNMILVTSCPTAMKGFLIINVGSPTMQAI